MYLDDIPRDRLTLNNAAHLPGAKIFRAPDGRIMLSYRGELYEWVTTPGGLGELDGFFSKIFKPIRKVVKKVTKPVRKVLSRVNRLHKKVTKPVRNVVKKYAGVIAPIAAFIPVVGWAVAAALTVVAIKEKKKKAKSAAEAAELEAQLQQAEIDAEEKRLAAEQAGYEKEYQAELERQMQAQQSGGQFAYGPGGGAAQFSAGGGGGGGGGYRGGGEPTNEGMPAPATEAQGAGFDMTKLIVPAITVAAVLLAKGQ